MNPLISILLAGVAVLTWNGNWFPSGRAEHRANPQVEAATISATAKMLRDGIVAYDPQGTNELVIVLNEIRNGLVASNLLAEISLPRLKIAAVSGYRRRDRFDQQQDVIMTTLPVVKGGFSRFSNHARETPPRGYAFADLIVDNSVTTRVYAVHLKSNYGATTPDIAELNRLKRAHSIDDILADAGDRAHVIIAGDFNTDKWRKEFAAETIFNTLEKHHYLNALEFVPADRRGTHPHKRYGDSVLDYIVSLGFSLAKDPEIVPNDLLSDHYAVISLWTALP